MQPGVTVESCNPLVELGVVLHRAGPERVKAGVNIEVALGEAVVVAHQLGLGDLGQPRRTRPPKASRDEFIQCPLGDAGLGGHERAAARL
jgi:hypothetical protein